MVLHLSFLGIERRMYMTSYLGELTETRLSYVINITAAADVLATQGVKALTDMIFT